MDGGTSVNVCTVLYYTRVCVRAVCAGVCVRVCVCVRVGVNAVCGVCACV
jgi:hypothetical protein